jgi:outer membrane receptor protein involved in Fe transport
LGLTVPDFHGFNDGLRLRHLGSGALIEDDSARSKSTTVVSAQLGYRVPGRYSASFEVLNIFNSRRNDITYYYASRLPGNVAAGVPDYHFHPIEPRLFRLGLSAEF